ncbi:HAMP domain-containing protein [Roseateles sp. DAIF2]|uniref:sensor histidine kinase n=1 Tax=Roseateles sp. DAIF2 TaxID=2714952 RepID=UPI0018A28EF6|nr:ATP-binding protein [Roseateles sp. DAIF2]QPF73494.1 HAMP domain-containing protein [Roseateles sp. DAIF2]
MRRLSGSSLRNAVVLALVVGLLVPTGGVLLYDLQTQRREAMDDLKRDLARVVEILALSLSEPIWQVSPDLAEPMIKAQVDDPRFVSVLVLEPSSPKPFLEFQRDTADRHLTLSQTRAVLRDGREIAQITVTMSAAPLLERRRQDMLRTLWRSGLTLTLSLALILIVMQRRVLQPMGRLSEAAAKLAAGRLEQPLDRNLDMSGSDEIARVGQAMERMRQALLAAFDELRQHAITLESQVDERTSELTAANAELTQALATLKTAQRELVESEKLASLGRLVAGVAHELNTPLGNALTVVSALEDRWGKLETMLSGQVPMRRSHLEELAKDTRRGQDILQRNVQKAADLVRDFKQVAIDQTTDLRRDFELARVIEDVLVMVEPSFKHTPFQIRTDLAGGIAMNSYPGALGQVLTNLLMNALVHGFEGRDKGLVTVRCALVDEDTVELQVRDDGRGMDESVRRRIFDPFFTTKLGTGGSGLGMHIVHNIVTNVLGGQIEVFSSPGSGARTVIRMPRSAPQHAAPITEVQP